MRRKSIKRKRIVWSLRIALVLLAGCLLTASLPSQEQAGERVSNFGDYKGYSEATYDSWVRFSQYLTMRDGVKLAIDIIRPAKEGKVHEEPLPVIWQHTRYRRAVVVDGKVRHLGDSSLNQPLLKHGYIMASADVRGSGASFGSWNGIFTKEETEDAYEINEWLASQPWCDGNVGMIGGSYLGITQLMAASTKPPHLKALFPIVALYDMYYVARPNGVFFDDFLRTWSELTRQLDTEIVAAPVIGDEDESMLKAAIEEHKQSRPLIEIFAPLKFRDSKDEFTGAYPYKEWGPAGFTEEINASGIPMYLWCGWFDSFTRDGFQMYRNFTAPRKIVTGAWSHSPRDPEIAKEEFGLVAVESLRWFDYWLKGIDNGIMNEDPIHYHVMNGPKDNTWQTAKEWPIPESIPTKYYFHEGPSGSVDSVNDGLLNTDLPQGSSGKDEYTVNYTTTTGTATRMDNAVGGQFNYPDMTANDEKGLTYTTPPLEEDVEITGHTVAHLWISSTATDGDFFLYLEEVDGEGVSHYVTEGVARASHRALHDPPYDNLGNPYHRSYEEDVKDLAAGDPVELAFDCHPTSNIFNAGHRIRITITCTDKDNASTPELSPPPTVTVYRSKSQPSYVVLPRVGAEPTEEETDLSLLLIIFVVVLIVVVVIVVTLSMRKKVLPK
jgi:putative CocE/NonD family hydrolase